MGRVCLALTPAGEGDVPCSLSAILSTAARNCVISSPIIRARSSTMTSSLPTTLGDLVAARRDGVHGAHQIGEELPIGAPGDPRRHGAGLPTEPVTDG